MNISPFFDAGNDTSDSYDYFVRCATSLKPIMQEIETFFKSISSDEFMKTHQQHIQWMSEPEVRPF